MKKLKEGGFQKRKKSAGITANRLHFSLFTKPNLKFYLIFENHVNSMET